MSTDKNCHRPERGILRSTSVMSAGTLLSRILGFIRDMVFARFFGTAAVADAFVLAFRIPNLFRDLMGEGAANSSFVPVMTEYKQKKTPDELRDFLNAVFSWAVLVLCGLTIVGIMLAPVIVRLIAPGFTADALKFQEAVNLTRIMFPYLIFIGLTAFFSAIQFTYGSFTMPALGPCLLNIVLIVSTLMAVAWMRTPIYGLAAGVIIGGILQFFFQWLPLKKHGVRFSFPRTLAHPGAKQVGRLLLPRILGSAVYQVNIFVDTICASLTGIVGPGGIASIYYAYRIVQFPMGIFGVALASAVLPAFAAHVAGERKEDLKKTVAFALENIHFVMLPMAIFLVIMAEPLVRVAFQRGAFDAYSTNVTSCALIFFSLGLMGYGGVRILAAAFHALQDTRTPVKVAMIALVVNAVLNVTLMFPMKISGIALASSIAAMVNLGLLYRLLSARLGGFEGYFKDFLWKLFLAGIIQGAVTWLAWQALPGIPLFLRLGLVFCLGMLVYGAVALSLRLGPAVHAAEIVTKHFNRK
jgi:putative peptidoglycan lipid II flippase